MVVVRDERGLRDGTAEGEVAARFNGGEGGESY